MYEPTALALYLLLGDEGILVKHTLREPLLAQTCFLTYIPDKNRIATVVNEYTKLDLSDILDFWGGDATPPLYNILDPPLMFGTIINAFPNSKGGGMVP